MAEVPGAQRSVLAGGPEPRDPLDCWACAVLVTAQNLLVAVFNLLLLALVLGTILLPAVTMLGFGFLCHSQGQSVTQSLTSLICTVPALPGTPLHRPSAGPRLHRPVGHWIPAAGTAACACLGHLSPPLPASPPSRLPSTLQPCPLQAPGHPTAEANPGLTRVPGCSHTGKGLGLRCVESRILSIVLLLDAEGLEASSGVFCLVLLLTIARVRF
ncbi:transmembrane protein 88 isoform X1 [Microtus pennsylvanicus]|uniref:transmembrane protein 88 isoform X1 n=1 Tax=Microtus pennsylvanicus TaxID=10058 RepID=UPI003F6B970C